MRVDEITSVYLGLLVGLGDGLGEGLGDGVGDGVTLFEDDPPEFVFIC
jgi:hypothetical protein